MQGNAPKPEGGERARSTDIVVRLWLKAWRLLVSTIIAVHIPERGNEQCRDTSQCSPQEPEYHWAAENLQRNTVTEVLDLGCGECYGMLTLKEAGICVVGIDRFGSALIAATLRHPGVRAVCSTAEMLPLRSETFDAVVSIQSLEHVLQPKRALAEIARVLKPGGMLVLTTPKGDPSAPFHSKFHVMEWTEAQLRELVASAGLTVVQSEARELLGSKSRVVVTERLAHFVSKLTNLPTPTPPRETLFLVAVRASSVNRK